MERTIWYLEERTAVFAENVRDFIRCLPRTVANLEDVKQLVRASGSVAANQIEADDPLGDLDRLIRFRICRKEARESGLWLRLLDLGSDRSLDTKRAALKDEVSQLVRIYSTIINRLSG